MTRASTPGVREAPEDRGRASRQRGIARLLDKNGIGQVAPRNELAAWKEELYQGKEAGDNRRRELEGKQFQERVANIARIAEANLAHIETVFVRVHYGPDPAACVGAACG